MESSGAGIEAFAHLLKHLREPLLIASKDGRVLASNSFAADMLGTSDMVLDGGALLASYSPEPTSLSAKLQRLQSEAQVPLRARDGRRLSAHVQELTPDLLLLRLSGEPAAESRTRALFEALSRLSNIGGVAAGQGFERVAEALLAEGVTSIGAAAGGIFLLDETGSNLELRVSAFYPEKLLDRYRMIPLSAHLPIVDTVKSVSPVFLGSIDDYRLRYRDFAEKHPEIASKAFASLPLREADDGSCFGALVIGFATSWNFSSEEQDFLSTLARQCSNVIASARRRETEELSLRVAERAARRLERLYALTGALAQAITPPQVVEAVVDMGMAASGATSGGLWLLSADGESVCLARGVGPTGPRPEHFQNIPLDRPSRMPILDAIRSGDPVWIESCGQLEDRYPDAHRAFSPTTTAMRMAAGGKSEMGLACLPLFAQGRRIGGLALNFNGVHRFLDDERAFLQVISWYSAQALERARLYSAEIGARAEAEENQRENARLYQEARDADRLKDEFLAMLSHELRNPLAPIQTALELMNLAGESAFERERALISRHLQHIVRLVDDLLDVSRITRGKIQLAKGCHELSTLIDGGVEMVRPLCQEYGHRLTITVPRTGLLVIADRVRLTQVIANLVSNAVKYTEPGGEIFIEGRAEGSDAIVLVRDSGIGIAPDLLPRIFDPFVQAGNALDRTHGGLGIGLTVVKAVMHLHGGSVSAASAGIGKGSELIIRLPLDETGVGVVPAAADSRVGLGSSASGPSSLDQGRSVRRVLVCDDNHDAATLLGEAFERLGCTVQIVHDGPSALREASVFGPELVLLDIGLPGMDGYELARHLRQEDTDPPRLLIAVTGYGQESDRARALEAGFDEHIVKPVRLKALRTILERLRKPNTE